jgi:peroxiredoxin
MKKIYILFFTIFICSNIFSQEYEIRVKIKNFRDSMVYLGFNHGKQNLVSDSAYADNKGYVIFKGNKKLENGAYFIAPKNHPYFEIILGNDRFFSIETDTSDFISNMKIKNSLENKLYYDYLKKISELFEKRKVLISEYEKNKENKEQAQKIIDDISKINEERENFMNGIIDGYPDYFLSKYLKSFLDIKLPDPPPTDENGNIDNYAQYLYLREHFFDNIDLSERGFVRTHIYEEKIDYFFSNLIPVIPDTIIHEVNKFIQKVYDAGDSLMFQYTASHLLHAYDTTKILGMDAVFVAIAEDWYLSGKTPWADDAFLNKLDSAVSVMSPTQIGKTAPDLIRMQSIDKQHYYTLSQLPQKYIILIFYEPNCGYCKKEVPKIMEAYRDTLKNLNTIIFAIYSRYDREEWETFVEKNNLIEEGWYNVWDGPYPHSNMKELYNSRTTPTIFVLDPQKKILANKSLNVDSMIDMIRFYNNLLENKADE